MTFPLRLILLLLIAGPSLLPAQDFNRYAPMRSSGEIPAFILTRTSEKYEAERQQLAQEGNRAEQESRDEFLLQSNYTMDAMLLSGKVLFNDPVGQYLNRIKDYLLREQPEARDSIRVFLVRSPQVNAFCTNNGIVLVHMGLLAKIGSEAQLAYVLTHEFQHYLEQHPINRYVENDRRRDQLRIVSYQDYEEYLLEKNRYSRDQELEADEKGLELYLNSEYAAGETEKVFDVMRYSYLPIAQEKLPLSTFESPHFWLPPFLQLDSLQTISAPEDYDDSKLDHPNIATRRELVEEKLADMEVLDGPRSIFGEDEFRRMQKICRFEMVQLYLSEKSYERAYYHAYILSQEVPRSLYLKEAMATALFGLAKYKVKRTFYDVHYDFEDIEGSSQQLYYLTERLNHTELTALSLNYIWRLHQDYPEHPGFYDMALDLMDTFVGENPVYAEQMWRSPVDSITRESMFMDTAGVAELEEIVEMEEEGTVIWEEFEEENDSVVSQTVVTVSPRKIDTVETEDGNPVAGLEDAYPDDDGEVEEKEPAWMQGLEERRARLERHRSSDQYFLFSAFIDLFEDPEFEKAYDQRLEDYDNDAGIWAEQASDYDAEDVDTREFQVNRTKGLELGVNKVVYLTPLIRRVDEKKNGLDYLATELALDNFEALMEEAAVIAGLDMELLGTNRLQAGEIEKFNDMVDIRNWITSKMDGGPAKSIPNPFQERAEMLRSKYGTDHFGLTGGIFIREAKSPRQIMGAMLAISTVFLSPIGIYSLIRPENQVYYINWVWNVETGKMVMDETRLIRGKARPRRLKSALYYSFLQIVSQP